MREGDRLQKVIWVDLEIFDYLVGLASRLPQRTQINVLWEETRGEQLEDAEFDARAIQRLENRAKGVRLGLARQRYNWELVVVDGLDPSVVDLHERLLRLYQFVSRHRTG